MMKGLVKALAVAMLLVGFQAQAKNQTKTTKTGVEQPMTAVQESDQATSIVSRYGAILDRRRIGVGGLTAWTLEKNGHQVVLYTTADAQALFTGVVWDAATGKNISDQFLPQNQISSLRGSQSSSSNSRENPKYLSAFDGTFTGPIPESMKTVDSLAGFKEGKGGIIDTVYIIIDPRCPYCRQAYNASRKYQKAGYSIKWIPAVALGDPANGLPLAATLLQSKDKNILARVLGNHEPIKTKPTKETAYALRTNLDFMFSAFEANGIKPVGVPVAFFIDRRTGKPRMITGISEKVVLEDIFGKH